MENECGFRKKIELVFPLWGRIGPETASSKMLTITLPRGIDASLNQIVQEEMDRCTELLAKKYSFSLEEAEQYLPEFKLVKKRGPIPKLYKTKAQQAVVAAPSKDPPQMSGYLLFSKTMRSDVQVVLSASLEGEQKLLPQLVVKELAVRWNALSVYEKKKWKIQAASKVPEAPVPLIAQDADVNQIDGELSRQVLKEIRADAGASAAQLPIEYERMTHWTVEQAVDYFESAGALEPPTEGISRLPLLQAQRGVAQHAPGWYEDEPRQERPAAPIPVEVKSEIEEESEEETTVVPFEIGGIKYLKDDENTLYDFETHDEVGVWNENKCCMETIMCEYGL